MPCSTQALRAADVSTGKRVVGVVAGFIAIVGVGFVAVGVVSYAMSGGDGADAASALSPEPVVVVDVDNTLVPAPSLMSASQAASRFVARGQDMLYADNDDLTVLISAGTTAAGHRDLELVVRDELAVVREALATAPPASTWFVVRPLTVSVSDLDSVAGTASASVWSVQLFSRAGVADPELSFTVTDMSLVWSESGWLVDSYSSRPGPAGRLASGQYPATAAELESRLDGHRLIDAETLEGAGL